MISQSRTLLSLSMAALFPIVAAGTSLPACTPDTLANYVTITQNPPASGGCATGGLDYVDFSYHPVTNAPLASSIGVTPAFSFGPVSAAPGQTVQFEIDYDVFIDSAGPIGSASLALNATGNVLATEFFCNDIPYIGNGLCLGSIPGQILEVGTSGTGFPSSASIAFAAAATNFQDVGIVFQLTGGASGASVNSLSTQPAGASPVPEPSAGAQLLIGLLTLASGYSLRNRRSQ